MSGVVLAAVAATLAVLVGSGPRPGPVMPRLLAPTAAVVSRRPGRAMLPLLAALFGVATCTALGGARAAVVATVVVAVGTTAGSLLRTRGRERRRQRSEAEVARACALLAAEVRAGRPPEAAVDVVAADCPVLGAAAAALAVGDDAVRAWRVQANRPGCAGLHDLARAWQVSRECGAAMGPSLDQVAAALEREAEVAGTVRGELASAQATGRLMSVLPLAGIGLGYSIGGRPLDFLLGTTVGLVCTLAATLLACTGIVWTQALAGAPGRGR